MDTREIFKKNLNRFIEQSGKNKKTISDEMKIPYTTLAEWANGNKFPRADGIEKLANYFKILKSDLLEESEGIYKYENIIPISTNNNLEYTLSAHEKNLVFAYRNKPEMQAAVDRLLGIDAPQGINIGGDIAETVKKTQQSADIKSISHSK